MNDVVIPAGGGKKLDVDFVRRHVSNLQTFLDMCPDPQPDDIGKMLAVQAGILQNEGLLLMQEAAELPGAAKMSRLNMAIGLLKAAESAFVNADRILARTFETKLVDQHTARREANAELLKLAADEGFRLEIMTDGTLSVASGFVM